MPVPSFAPSVSFFSAFNAPPLRPLHTLVRTTEERFRPARVMPHRPTVFRSQVAVLGDVASGPNTRATILRERGHGRVPTIVLGGLVPDAAEQVFLLRRFLLKSGDVHYVHYPREAFSLSMVCAQLDDLVTELAEAGQPPVVIGVSFGAGIVLEWLRRARARREEPLLAGVVLVSPVSCVADLITPGTAKPATLLGRALKPYLAGGSVPDAVVEKTRALFVRMFEAGAQNKQALRLLMTKEETVRLRDGVMNTIRQVSARGAQDRARALTEMMPPTEYFSPVLLPLTDAPALVLFAQNEDVVLETAAPVRFALERAVNAYFSRGVSRVVAAKPGQAPVQHASLVFHVFEFLPSLQAFYQHVRRSALAFAA